MGVIKDIDFINDVSVREEHIGRVEVLDKVKELNMLAGTEYMVTNQVADFYDVERNTINQLMTRNQDEFEYDGIKTMTGNEVASMIELGDNQSLTSKRGRGVIIINGTKLAYAKNTLFTKRAILRVGMLLEQSKVAKEVRTLLLNVYRDAEQGKENIIGTINEEINEEKSLMLERVEAEMSGNWDSVFVINAKLFNLKNKRIKELEKEKKDLINHSLTIEGSLSCIKAIINHISSRHYNNKYPLTWNELHKKVNYKLGINVRNRLGTGSLISKYTEDELRKVETIARSWAVDLGYDLDEILRIGV